MVVEDTHVTEASTHNNGLVPMLLVIVEDLFDALNAGVIIAFVILPGMFFVPIENLRKCSDTTHLFIMRNAKDSHDRRRAKSR
jgi:hypothetical protein